MLVYNTQLYVTECKIRKATIRLECNECACLPAYNTKIYIISAQEVLNCSLNVPDRTLICVFVDASTNFPIEPISHRDKRAHKIVQVIFTQVFTL